MHYGATDKRGAAAMNRFEHRRVLVTGGGSGIGQATVLRMLQEGGRVVAADVSRAGLEDTVAKVGWAASCLTTVEMDVADEQSVIGGVRRAADALGGLDVLVNAAPVEEPCAHNGGTGGSRSRERCSAQVRDYSSPAHR